jgi:hypothetical protein
MRRVSQFITSWAMLGLCVALVGCARTTPPATQTPGGASTMRAEKAHKDAQTFAVHVALAGDTAQAKFPPDPTETKPAKPPVAKPKGPPTPKTPPRTTAPIVRERVVSGIAATEAEADDDAVERVRDLIALKLSQLDPPVDYKPSANEVRAEFIRKESRTVRPPDDEDMKKLISDLNVSGNPVYVEYDVEVSAEQVRELRSQDRVSSLMRVVGGLFALALFGFLFLRADEWTKGYLTSWLAIGAVVLAGGAAAALIFI